MRERTIDIWSAKADAWCVTTNGILKRSGALIMGAGIAKQAVINFPGIDRRLGKLVRECGNYPFFLADVKIMSFPTKMDWRDDSDVDLIIQSAQLAVKLADEHNLEAIAMPRVGCGHGNLHWDEVKLRIEHILDDRFTVCYNGQ